MKQLPKRIVTASSLFDGHDVSINILRRILQSLGAEIIHLGHNRSVADVAKAALEEDAHAVAISSYQGGHMEYFLYLKKILKEQGQDHVKIFGGGGGVIVPSEIEILEKQGIERIYTPSHGQELGLVGIGKDLLSRCQEHPLKKSFNTSDKWDLSQGISAIEQGIKIDLPKQKKIPVLGITGTGGAGKSSLIDELLIRFHRIDPSFKVMLLSIDPTRKRTGGALLGDRIRMGNLIHPQFYLRSLATRESQSEITQEINEILSFIKSSDYSLIIIETSGIGQASDAITSISDACLYVMTPEYGASSQLEKIEMLHASDFIAINKFERAHGEDALRDVQKQYQRNKELFDTPLSKLPIFGTSASEFNNKGVNELFKAIAKHFAFSLDVSKLQDSQETHNIIPKTRVHYLHQISECIKKYHKDVEESSKELNLLDALAKVQSSYPQVELKTQEEELKKKINHKTLEELNDFHQEVEKRKSHEYEYSVGLKKIKVRTVFDTLSHKNYPRVFSPNPASNLGLQFSFLKKENFPGFFPYTAGVFPYKNKGEEVKRQFAGEGGPKRTNARFHFLTKDDNGAARLSVAFDSVTLYGEDPHIRPDIFGKIGEAGVSIATLDDMIDLFQGFKLLDPQTSVSMTINGPAPIILAMFMNAAIKQQLKGEDFWDIEKRKEIMRQVRGTVQADILKEDQAQNTCIFSLPFAIKMMGDVQEYFSKNKIKRYYTVSISGYHMAEAGANPITQLAFTLANGFTYLEYYLNRGINVDDICSNLSFFFSNGLDLEYSVLGRVARRIWSIAIKNLYNGSEISQKLKYHIQTSGRSLHAQEMTFNDIRTTLQAFLAISDFCNSLHTNAFDEAITTPTAQSVRQAMAIQKIINNEFGMNKVDNPLQGSYMIEQLTDIVEEAVLEEFERIGQRGGVLGAMEYMYQRSKIQDESFLYESQKDSGEYKIIGVNTFLADNSSQQDTTEELSRSSDEEKHDQITRLNTFHEKNKDKAQEYTKRLAQVAISGENIFEELLLSVNFLSLGQISNILYNVGGQYRRNI